MRLSFIIFPFLFPACEVRGNHQKSSEGQQGLKPVSSSTVKITPPQNDEFPRMHSYLQSVFLYQQSLVSAIWNFRPS